MNNEIILGLAILLATINVIFTSARVARLEKRVRMAEYVLCSTKVLNDMQDKQKP